MVQIGLKEDAKQTNATLALSGMSENKEQIEGNNDNSVQNMSEAKLAESKGQNRRYMRNRGKNGTKPMSYYLPQDLIDMLNVKAAKERVSKSSLVVEGLRYVLKEEIKAAKAKEKRATPEIAEIKG